ncbi:hypothetical protein M0R19_09145, partial [Candidatus Pacearchaeota archaeon]|nr:hypothetical protein [Candidatus Pacearchaeota archaeon]
MSFPKRKKGIIIFIIIAIVVIAGIFYFLFSSKLLNSNKSKGLSDTVGSQNLVSDNNILQAACKNAFDDYPQWTRKETDIIFWENPDKSFSFRNSPEDSSTILSSPIPPTETLVDMDFIELNEISYVATGDNVWKIGLLKINPYEKSLIYEKNETSSFINISPINKNEFIIFSSNGNKATLRYLNMSNSDEKILLNTLVKNTDSLKLAVSPKGTDFYLLDDGILKVFEISSKKQSDEINLVESAVWIGNDHI